MSIHHVAATEQLTVFGPAKVDITGNSDAPVKAAMAAPTLTSIAPNTAAKGGSDEIVDCTGTNFNPACDVLVGGVAQPAIYVSTTLVRAQVPVKSITAAGTTTVAVRSGSQVTAPQTFTYT